MRAGLFIVIVLTIPLKTEAALFINEVAWMGSTQSANHEWIELHNSGGSAIDVSGYELTDGMNLSIPLVGSVGPGEFAVLERTSDDSAPGTAFLIYTGALVNTGATLVLKKSDGTIADQVAGGTDWKDIGGDNVTKETAQLTNVGWVTGTPTPGRTNTGTSKSSNEASPTDDTNPIVNNPAPTSPTTASTRSRSSGETVRLELKDSTLSLKVDGQKVGYVNQQIDFSVTPADLGRNLANSLVYNWNFGDGNTKSGREVSHTFLYPGTYVVTIHAAFARQEQLARHEITILPVTVSLTTSPGGDIQVNNDSPYELDISGYVLSASQKFTFPNYSIILPKETITIPRSKIGPGTVLLKDNQGVVVGSLLGPAAQSVSPSLSFTGITPQKPSVLGTQSQTENSNLFSFATTASSPIATTAFDYIPEPEPDNISNVKPAIPNNFWPYLSLVVVIIMGLIGTIYQAKRN